MMRENEEREGERRDRGGPSEATRETNKERDTVVPPSLGGGRHQDKVTISFFVSNFLEDVSYGDLWKLFLTFGRVWEIFYPAQTRQMEPEVFYY